MSKSTRPILIMLSVFALLNVVFVPIFDVWGGLFPSDVDRNFFEVIEIVFEDADDWSLWVVQLTMSIFIPSVFMFIMSLVGKRGLFITANVVGIILWFKQIIAYGMEDDGFEDLFDFEDGSISIGTWIAIAIFIISFFVALNAKKKADIDTFTNRTVITKSDNTTTLSNVILCNSCGKANDVNVQYCADCGNAINSTNTVVENNSTTIRFCPSCGAQIENSMQLCGKCGNKL